MVSAHPHIASECGSFDAQRWKQVAQTAKRAESVAAIDSERRVLVSNSKCALRDACNACDLNKGGLWVGQ